MSTNSPQEIALSVVVPVYKEEANIRPFLARLEPVLEKIGPYEIIFCLDPSPDRTEARIEEEIRHNPRLGLLVFSRRFGQPAATVAGILHCRGNACAVIDVDLQDPPELLEPMFHKLREGYEVVLARRRSRKGENFVKLAVSAFGYWVINHISDVEIPRNTGDFRVMTRRVMEELRRLHETHGFLRGLVAFVGFRQAFLDYDRDERVSGKGNYNRFTGSLKIGFNGLVGFSNFLLKICTGLGLAVTVSSFFIILYVVISKFIRQQPFPMGVPAIICLILFIGGVQLLSLGIMGEYVGRIYDEVKRRPQFIIDRKVNLAPRQEP